MCVYTCIYVYIYISSMYKQAFRVYGPGWLRRWRLVRVGGVGPRGSVLKGMLKFCRKFRLKVDGADDQIFWGTWVRAACEGCLDETQIIT